MRTTRGWTDVYVACLEACSAPDVVHPEQGAQEGVAGADDEGQDGAGGRVGLEHRLDAALLNQASQDLGLGRDNEEGDSGQRGWQERRAGLAWSLGKAVGRHKAAGLDKDTRAGNASHSTCFKGRNDAGSAAPGSAGWRRRPCTSRRRRS